ncbi:bifunctional proline dehydrogenase/L-glutamate gamma-semialdehyde dehydrogenase [Prosthecobacter sp.]|uniref:bifunctional proline dehydrogenase/L-glutamate gamma-semialdehyde dehydrogenase n=1 Tax=Prosthecobacter sp. TaxID=1965333 RepID=UPI0037834F37
MNSTVNPPGRPQLASSFSKSDEGASEEVFLERVATMAECLLSAALSQQTGTEQAEAAKLGRLMNDPAGRALTFAMVDEVFRSHDPAAEARRWRSLLRRHGVPQYPPLADRVLMGLGAAGSLVLPGVVMKAVAKRMRKDSERVILEGEREPLREYLSTRTAQGFRINLNHLGEAVLGEAEAERRLEAVLEHLADPLVRYMSVKISAIFSQINLIAWDETLEEIKKRLRRIYRAAAKDGKWVNLDMEEYRDLALTVEAFRGVLDEPEFHRFSAGIALQGYLPDSGAAQRELTEWACRRVAGGGAPIKIRLVKGANLAMEAVEAEMHGWEQAPYATKAETDANFRRLLEYGCQPEHAAAVRLGVATHNLFDVALALTLRERHGVGDRVEIEMLEGMANHQARAVRDAAGGLLLYAPAVQHDDFLSAMAYLVRRLDENTAPENFLRGMFAMRPGSVEWEEQRARFERGWKERGAVSCEPRRKAPAVQPGKAVKFENEPDSDWTQAATRAALNEAVKNWQPAELPPLPELEEVLQTAVKAQAGWEALGVAGRAKILNRAADLMSAERFTALACMRVDGRKATPDADGEVSEAIDFARYYARTGAAPEGVKAEAVGVVAVVSPWNFPYAIPAGGVCAALMAGNSVVFKPAHATVQTAWLLARQLWAAGVPREVLQFFPCDNSLGTKLITDARISCVVLTGSYETARKFQTWRPGLPLLAETSGKNALIITAQADRELAIKDLVRSAFGHSGQKCSAASLGILEAEVYDDPVFRRQLRDAAASLPAGAATDARSVVTPLVLTPGKDLQRALTKLDEGEEWLLEPRQVGDDPCAWTPGIKLGVRAGSWFHLTECFGPVLGLMRAESLAQATEWQNGTAFGLTAGLHSLDPEETGWWREHAQAGNLYINRAITGAIVQRQPFGGWKKSCIGPGAKAGGPNYVMSFCRLSDAGEGVEDYQDVWENYFSVEHDPSALRCESNVFRYRACRGVILRMETRDEVSIERAERAAEITGAALVISVREEESDAEFTARLPELARGAEFLRTEGPVGDEVLRAAQDAGLNWIHAPVLRAGRMELTRWLREQSVSETRHRYGQMRDGGV